MKRILLFLSLMVFAYSMQSQVIISGIFDGPLSGGKPKLIECYALSDVYDLSLYGIESANNGSVSNGTPEYVFPADTVLAGTYFYIGSSINDTTEMMQYFGFHPDYYTGSANNNGDDALLVYENGTAIDHFGVVGEDGSGKCWEYMDGWAYRTSASSTPTTTFACADWAFSGPNAVDGCDTNSTCSSVFPLGTYVPSTGCMGMPIAGTLAGPVMVCDTTDFILNLTGQTIDAGISYAWEESADGVAFTTIAGAMSYDLTTQLSADMWYRVIVTCTNTGDADTSNVAMVMVNPNTCECYCTYSVTNAFSTKLDTITIGNVTVGTDTSACETYTLHTNPGISMSQGESVFLHIDNGNCSSQSFYAGYVMVLADWDADGDYTDVGDTVRVYGPTVAYHAIPDTSFVVPSNAVVGSTSFRIIHNGSAFIPDVCGNVTWGEVEDFCIDVTPAAPTCTPTSLGGVSALVLDSTKAAVIWDVTPDAGFFKIQYRELGTSSWTLINVKNLSYQRVSTIISGLTPNTTYQYRARMQCPDFAVGPYTPIQTFNTFTASPCDIPAASKIVFMSIPDKVRIFLDYEPEGEKFDVRWRLQGTVPVLGNKVFRKSTSVMTGLTPDTDYEYRVRTKCSGVWTGYSAWVPFTTNAAPAPIAPPASSRNDLFDTMTDASVKVYPNPMSQTLNLEFDKSGEKQIRMMDMSGRIVLNEIVQNTLETLDVERFPQGTYFLQVIFENGEVLTKKVVK